MADEILYTPPAMLEEIDDEIIHARMMDSLPPDIDHMEGGFAYDFTKPAALEKAAMMVDINEAIQMFFPAWSYGMWLDQIAGTVGLKRRPANCSAGYLTVMGVPDTVIPSGFLFAAASTSPVPNIEFEAVEQVVIGESGTARVLIRCVTAGLIGNMPANSVTLMASPIASIETIGNEAAITGGTEEEDDDSLRERIQERNRGIDASYAGSIADYRRWTLEVPGVGDVIVVPEWEGPGTGTVKLIIVDQEGEPANAAILAAVYDHIMSPDDPLSRKAPIGAILTVEYPREVELTVEAFITTASGYAKEDILAEYRAALKAYMTEAAKSGVVRYTRIGGLLSHTEGITDYSDLLLNNDTENITVEPGNYPTIKGVTLHG